MRTTRRILDAGWRFRELEPRGNSEASDLPWLPAQVPGHVHLDLVRNGVIEDPFQGMAERSCAWVDETDWVYETTFQVDEPPTHAYLVFHGLDTIAEIYLNDALLGMTDNMFIPHEFAVGTADGRRTTDDAASPTFENRTSKIENPTTPSPLHPFTPSPSIRAGANTLRVIFRSALRVGRERQQAWADAGEDTFPPHWFTWAPRSFVRKAQYMYGWDWGPELVSCGIWQKVELVTVPVARILDWKHQVELSDANQATVNLDVTLERTAALEQPVLLDLSLGQTPTPFPVAVGDRALPRGQTASVQVPDETGIHHLSVTFTVDNPVLWTPNGASPVENQRRSAMYPVSIALRSADRYIAVQMHHIGIRKIELIREPDRNGESFMLRVNGVDTFMKGANWIPADSFPGRLHQKGADANLPRSEARVRRLLRMARKAGFKMLRVWGGGLYESEEFYRRCDEYGIMVWQDFPYGCAYYPDSPDYLEAARKEATAAVRRIRNHPSLALWCGNNENSMLWHDHWEGREHPAPRFLGEKIYDEVLPEVIAAEDPKTPYWPSSPYGGDNSNAQEIGDRHDWDVWHGVGDWIHYPEDDSRFLSEFGFASSCGLTAWNGCLAESDKWPYSPAVRWHDKTRKGYDTYLGYVKLHYPEPKTLEDLVYYSQLNQADALKYGIEHWRRRKGRCWGTLFWQINDCWPVQSWAVIDSALEPKAAYYAAKRFYAPVLLSLVRKGDEAEVHLTSDLLEHIQGDVTVAIESFDGDVLSDETFEAYVDANGTAVVGTFELGRVRGHERDVYVYARFEPYWDLGLGPIENYLFLAEPKDLRLPDPGLSIAVTSGDDRGFALTLAAQRFAPSLWWRLDGMSQGCRTEDNFFHLRATQSRTLHIPRGAPILTPDDLRSRLRLRTL